jgi:outer membrane immunogenic protein
MMLRAFVGGLALAAGAGLSSCSDGGRSSGAGGAANRAAVAYVQPVYNWSGFYVGGHIGGGFADSSWSDPFTGANNTFNKLGFLAAVRSERTSSSTRSCSASRATSPGPGSGSRARAPIRSATPLPPTTNWTSTVTGRVGAAFDRLLVYGKGGVAFAQDQSSLTDLGANTASTTFMRTGWTAGAGLEYGLSQNWSAKIEYDYLGFGSKALNFLDAAAAGLHNERQSQRPGSQGRAEFPLWAVRH